MNKNKLLYGMFSFCFSLLLAVEDVPSSDTLVSAVTHNGCVVQELSDSGVKTILSAVVEKSDEDFIVKIIGNGSIDKYKDVKTHLGSGYYSSSSKNVVVELFQGKVMIVLDVQKEKYSLEAVTHRDENRYSLFNKSGSSSFNKKLMSPLNLRKCTVVVDKNNDGRDMLVVRIPYLNEKEKVENNVQQDILVTSAFEK